MSKKKLDMEPGKRYRGYGLINEYGEFIFEQEDTGSHAGREKCICAKEGIKVTQTKNLIIIKFNLQREESTFDYVKALTKVFNTIYKIFNDYEI